MSYFKYQNKNVFYSESGAEIPVVFLHGNTASSKMFSFLLPLYTDFFHVILIDFLGHGQSDRLPFFPTDLWMDQAKQTITLLEHLKYKKVHLIGTSGGAFVALNVALLRPDLVDKVVADSFEGRELDEHFAENLKAERNYAIHNEQARMFYEWCQGDDWHHIVDCDTQALLTCAKQNRPLYFKSLDQLKVPVLLMGSKMDDQISIDLMQEYKAIQSMVKTAQIYMFESGEHPAILSNAEKASEVICKYLLSES